METSVLYRALQLVCSRFPKLLCALLAVCIVQGIVPTYMIALTATIVQNIVAADYDSLRRGLYLWVFLSIMLQFFIPLYIYLQSTLGDKFNLLIHQEIISTSLAQTQLYNLENKSLQDDIALIQNEAAFRPLNFIVSIIGSFRDCITFISSVIIAYNLLGATPSSIIILSSIINFMIFKHTQTQSWEESLIKGKKGRILLYLMNLLIKPATIKEILLFNFAPKIAKRYKNLANNIIASITKIRNKQLLFASFSLLVSAGLYLFLAVYIAHQISHQHFSVDMFIVFLQLIVQLSHSINGLGHQCGWVQSHLLFFKSVFKFTDITHIDKPLDVHPVTTINTLNLQQVNFRYPESTRDALVDINLSITKGEKIGLVGVNGSGKTSLLKLICGMYFPTSGNIKINDTPIQHLDLKDYRNKIQAILQDYNQYSFTLRENIHLLSTKINDSSFKGAIDFAHLHDSKFINNLEHIVGKEFGDFDFSGGESQRIAHARCYIHPGDLIILDEPTAHLDPATATKIMNSYFTQYSEKTILLITHHPEYLKYVDRIIILDNGKIVDDGARKELWEKHPAYREFL